MPKFRKKPVIIEAIKWTGHNLIEISDFVGERLFVSILPPSNGNKRKIPPEAYSIMIPTFDGERVAIKGDWIIREPKGGFNTFKPEIFEKTYGPVTDRS